MKIWLLALALVVFAFTGACAAKFTENVVAQVFDQNWRPVEGADVYVDYQLNAVDGYIKTLKVESEDGISGNNEG